MSKAAFLCVGPNHPPMSGSRNVCDSKIPSKAEECWGVGDMPLGSLLGSNAVKQVAGLAKGDWD